VGIDRIIGVLALKHLAAAESIDERCPPFSSAWLEKTPRRKDEACWVIDIPVPEAPHTIKENWIPFLTFFLRRIFIWQTGLVN
jgi:hypothetical protein